MMQAEDIDLLDRLQAEAGPHGIRCVQSIVAYLRAGHHEAARAVRHNEGDKTRTHTAVEEQLHKMFGCRAHGVHDCTHWLCDSLRREPQ